MGARNVGLHADREILAVLDRRRIQSLQQRAITPRRF